jgi:hypothetical protein
MKSREDREKFEKQLTALVKKYNGRNDVYESIINKLADKMTTGDIARIWSGNKQLIFLSDLELLLFSQAFYNSMDKTDEIENINPKNIFTDNEFNQALHITTNVKIKKDSMTFKEVKRVYQKNTGYIYRISDATIEQIYELVENNIVNYNFDSQREAIIEQLFGEEIKIPKIYPEKTQAIAEKILNDKYYAVDTIIINVLKTGAEKITFTPKYGENIGDLTIYKVEGSTNDEVDGANRIQGIVKVYSIAKERNIKIDVPFKIDVTNVVLKTSNEIITQINSQTEISEERIKSLEPSKFITIAKDINNNENEELNIVYHKFAESVEEYNKFNKIGTIQALSEGLEDHFKEMLEKNNPSLYKDILEYEVNFFNEFMGAKFKYLEDISKSKEITVLFDINMVYALIYISKVFFELWQVDYKLWRQTIKKVARSFNFSKENKDWEKLRTTGKLTPKAKKEFISYFQEAIKKEEDEVALASL